MINDRRDRASELPQQPAQDPGAHLAGLPGVAEAVDRARAAVDGLRGHRVLRRRAEEVAAESALRGARASAALDGVDVPLEDLRREVARSGTAGDLSLRPEVLGALRVATEVGSLQGSWARAPMQVVARLHTLAAAGRVPDDELGRPEVGAAARLDALGDLLTWPTSAPALVIAAVAHAELVTMGAFGVGAGLVGRAAGRLTMVVRGLDPGAVGVPEVGHVEIGREVYHRALDGYRQGGATGIAAWLVHCAEAVELGAREGVAVCEAIQRGG